MCDEQAGPVLAGARQATSVLVGLLAVAAGFAVVGAVVSAVEALLPALMAGLVVALVAGFAAMRVAHRYVVLAWPSDKRVLNPVTVHAARALPAPPLAIEAGKPVIRLVPDVVPEANERTVKMISNSNSFGVGDVMDRTARTLPWFFRVSRDRWICK